MSRQYLKKNNTKIFVNTMLFINKKLNKECCDTAQNQNSLLVTPQIDNPSPGSVTGGNQSLALTREVNLDTLSSDSSEEEIRDSGRSFQCPIVWGKKLYI